MAGSVRLSICFNENVYAMQQHFKFTAMAMLVGSLTFHLATADDSAPKCFYGTTMQGDEKTPIEPCGSDVNGIGANTNVLAVMRTFNIPTNIVVFQACPGGRFSVMPEGDNTKRFLVRYPSTLKSNYLSPIVHELAHIVQIRDAGGIATLNSKESSRRIELGADFLAGLAFNMLLQHLNSVDFETNLELAGSYKTEVDDHGRPEHRGQAFRRGFIRLEPYPELTISEALTYWNSNDFARFGR